MVACQGKFERDNRDLAKASAKVAGHDGGDFAGTLGGNWGMGAGWSGVYWDLAPCEAKCAASVS